jgi:hypothetical protein
LDNGEVTKMRTIFMMQFFQRICNVQGYLVERSSIFQVHLARTCQIDTIYFVDLYSAAHYWYSCHSAAHYVSTKIGKAFISHLSWSLLLQAQHRMHLLVEQLKTRGSRSSARASESLSSVSAEHPGSLHPIISVCFDCVSAFDSLAEFREWPHTVYIIPPGVLRHALSQSHAWRKRW